MSGDKCPVCGGAINDNESACSVCGTVFTPDESKTDEPLQNITCPDCGNMVPEGEKTCDECGSRVGSGSKDDYEDIDDREDEGIEFTIDEEVNGDDDTPIKLDEDFDLDNLDQHMEDLLKLPGVGPLRAKILLEAGYDDLRKLKRASVMELVKIKGIGRKSAGEIKTALRDVDLEEIRKKKLDKDQIEEELTCPLCNTIVSVYEVACYECGTALKDHHAQVVEGDPDSMALAYYDTKLKEDPANAELWYARGATLIKMEEFDKALASFDKSLEMDPTYQNVWISKAEVYNKMGEPMKAAECYSHVISASTDSDDDYEEIGNGFGLSDPVDDIQTEEILETEDEPEEVIEETVFEEEEVAEVVAEIVEEAPEEEPVEEVVEEEADLILEEPNDIGMDDGLGDDLDLGTPSEPVEEVVEEVEQEPEEEDDLGIELVEAEPELEPEPVEEEEAIEPMPEPVEEPDIQPAQEIRISPDDIAQVQEEVIVEKEAPPEPVDDPNDPKVLKKTLSIHAVAIKPLLILAKELSIDVLTQKKIIAQGVNESKKKNLSGAVALMKQGRRQIEEAFIAKANENLGAIAEMSRELILEGHNVDRISDILALSKSLLEKGDYKESFDKMNVALAMVENIRAEG